MKTAQITPFVVMLQLEFTVTVGILSVSFSVNFNKIAVNVKY